MRASPLATIGRGTLAAILSLQIIVGDRPWFIGGGWRPRAAHAAPEVESSPTPAPNGSAPADRVKGDVAAGFDYGVSTNSGAFTTSIPIETPPGRLGVEPKLALAYSSSSSAPGIAGVGWDLALPTLRLDPDAPYLAPARYLLDGQRLVADPAAPGGYATERDTYARIRKTCVANDCTFTVDDHAGVRLRFGGTAEARQLGRWGLDRVEDAHGNYMTISYMTDTDFVTTFGSGEYLRDGALLPRELRYTGSASRAPWYTVRFDYDLRPSGDDYAFQWGWGTERLRYRLKAIRVLGADGVTIRTYALGYTLLATGRSALTSVAITGLGGAAGPQPFAISYVASPSGFAPATAAPAAPLDSRVVVGDFNGDGRSDLATYRRTDDGGLHLDRWRIQLGTATGLGPAAIWLTGHPYDFPGPGGCATGKDAVFAGDWDGDGDTDLFHYAAGCGGPPRWQVLVAEYDHFVVRDWVPAAETGPGSALDVGTGTLMFGDVTGDGRADALIYRGAQNQGSTLVQSRADAPGYAIAGSALGVTGPLAGSGDFNGDRLIDVITVGANGLTAACATGDGHFYPCGSAPFPAGASLTTGDFNGDGLTDLLVRTPSTTTLHTSARFGFYSRVVSAPAGHPADVDGDGRDDLVSAVDTTGTGTWVIRTWLQRGFVWIPGANAGFPDLPVGAVPACSAVFHYPELHVADFTGDGRADPLLRLRDTSGGDLCPSAELATTAMDAPAVDRLATIRTPTGLTLQPTYQRSINPGLPIALPVVKELWIRDFPRVITNRLVSPVVETHRYQFWTGRWDAARGELMGFQQGRDEIVERNLSETVTYHQDVARRGKPQLVVRARVAPFEVLSADNYVYRDDPAPPYRTEVAWHARAYWAGGVPTERSLQGFEYDASGNQSRVIDHGLCSRTDDDRTTDAAYRTASDFNVNRVAQVELYAGAPTPPASLAGLAGTCAGSPLALVESTRHEYDGATAAVVRGDLTRTHRLVLGTNPPSWLRVRDYGYRADGLPTSSTDARGFVTQVVAFDPVLDLYPARTRDPVGAEEVREYEPHFGKLARLTDANGAIQTLTYDPFGRPRALHTPLADPLWMHTATWVYGDGFPNWTARLSPYRLAGGGLAGSAEIEFRDGLGRTLATVRDADSMQDRVVANRAIYWTATRMPAAILPPAKLAAASCGPVLTCLASWASSNPALIDWATLTAAPGTPAVLTYDPLGRATRRDNPDGSYVSYAHTVDALGFGLRQIDEVGDQRRIYRDARGDIARVERWPSLVAPPSVTTYQHDARRKLTAITSPLGVATTLTWSSLGRLDRVASPELGTIGFGYDADGHEVSRTDGRGVVTTTTVDALGRPTSRTASTGEFAMWVYDRDPLCLFSCSQPAATDNTMGRPWAVLDPSGFTSFAYDGDGHLARETRSVDGRTLTTRYVTWPTGQLVDKTYPDGEAHHFALAPDGQQVALYVGADPAPTVAMTRDALGRPAAIEYASGATTKYHVDPVTQRVDQIATFEASGSLAQQLTYDLRPDGVVEAIHRSDALSGGEDLYTTHDGTKRITDVHVAPEVKQPAEHYEYDADGRMQVRKDRGAAALAVGHADPQHPNAVTGLGARSFRYDAGGNRIAELDGGATTRTLGYDGPGRLATVDAGAASYVYDADGRRVIERVPAGTRIVTAGYTIEPDGSTRKLLQLGALRLGERSSVAGNRFFHADAVGSVIGETDRTGKLDTSRTFSAFGVAVDARGGGSRYGFGGFPVDDVTGLSFAAARYYDPTTASFTQADTWLAGFDDPEALNGYAYAANSPYQYADPSGHFPVAIVVGFAIAFLVNLAIEYADPANPHPDWRIAVLKSALLAAISVATTFGVTSWLCGSYGVPRWAALFAGRVISGGITAAAAQAADNLQHGGSGGYRYAVDRGILAGAAIGLVTGGAWGDGSTEFERSVTELATVFSTMYVRHVVETNPDTRYPQRINPHNPYFLEAPVPSAVAPPACGRADGRRTMPLACEAAAP